MRSHSAVEITSEPGAAAPFVWPPAPASPASGAAAEPAPPVPAAHPADHATPRLGELIRAFERAWLVPVAESLASRMRSAGWAPDAFDHYCNRCGGNVGPHESDEFGCAACVGRRLPWSRFVRLGEYETPLDAWVKEVKFGRSRSLGGALGRLLGRRLRQAGALAPAPDRVVVTPIPSSFRRRMSRGVDHALVIARGVARELRVPVVPALQTRHRPSQRSVTFAQRRRNAAGAFERRRGVDLAGWTVILVDDVRTSGATLKAAARALRAGDGGRRANRRPDIWAAALATTEEGGRSRERQEGEGGAMAGGVVTGGAAGW